MNYKPGSYDWEKISVGSDESGKGDFFGAPSITAVYLSESSLETLKKQPYFCYLKDSKKLSDDKIKDLAPKIMSICETCTIDIVPLEYNNQYDKVQNLNVLMAVWHNQAHSRIKGAVKVDRIVDGFVPNGNVEKYYEYLRSQGEEIVRINIFEDKCESKYLSVALASIVARFHFITKIANMSLKSGVRIPMGAAYEGVNSVFTAYSSLRNKGYTPEQIEYEFVKRNFKTLEKIKQTIK